MQRVLPFFVLIALFAACNTGKTRRVDIGDDDPLMGTGLESADVETMEHFAKSLIGVPELTGPNVEGVPTVAIHPVSNDTRFDFDGELFVRRIRQQLVEHGRRRIRFVTRDEIDEAMLERERAAKRAGEYTSSKQETKTGADFYLTGTASAISKAGRGRESDAIWIDFRLVDSENGEIIWERALKTKKYGKAGVIYR